MGKISRRTLVSCAVAASLPCWAWARGDGGSRNQEKQKKKAPKERVTRLLSSDLTRMSSSQIQKYQVMLHDGRVKVDGFSDVMAQYLFFMLKIDKRRTQRLINDMSKLRKRKDRRARLIRERDLVYKETQKQGSKRLYSSYIEYLEIWARSPSQGK